MRQYLSAAAVAGVLFLSGSVTTKPHGLEVVDAPSLEQLGGDWKGEWASDRRGGGIAITIKPASSYAVTTVDGRST